MRVVLAGASGFLGTPLISDLAASGHEVTRLVRREPRGAGERSWDPAGGRLDPEVLASADAVINLAGASASRPWTDSTRRAIRDSRVTSTSTIAAAAALAGCPILLNASAIGYYGDQGDQPVDESSPPGEGFLAAVCQDWERATEPAALAGVRVVRLRTGLVLSPTGGLLKPLLPLFKLGLGARFGDGRQYWPWISLPDWISAVRFLLDHEELDGPVNLVGPAPVPDAEFTATLARVLGRPAWLSVPGTALRLALRGFEAEVLSSRRVLPGVLAAAGFEFRHRDLGSALRAVLTAPPGQTSRPRDQPEES